MVILASIRAGRSRQPFMVNGSNHSYEFCVKFCSRMKLTLSEIILKTKGICILEHTKIHMRQHNVIFNTDFQLVCDVENYINLLENELPVHL
jgi:hypothetical protein